VHLARKLRHILLSPPWSFSPCPSRKISLRLSAALRSR
jgi:hypothetical protein